MRKTSILIFTIISVFSSGFAFAQSATLNQNFDVSCAMSSGFPSDWFKYNPPSTTYTGGWGQWGCDPTLGRKNGAGTPTPGMKCTGIWSSAYHLDTSYLGSPLLDFSSYASYEYTYLLFDTKTDIFTGSSFSVIIAPDGDTTFSSVVDSEITSAAAPVFGPGDASDWVTHKINMNRYKTYGPFYIGFRYVSPATSGSIWYLDNVNINIVNVKANVSNIGTNDYKPITIIGQSTGSSIRMSFDARVSGHYDLTLFDMMGRAAYKTIVDVKDPSDVLTLRNLDILPGLYLIKMTGENQFLSSKVLVQ